MLHLTGNLNHFVGAQLAGAGYVRDREREFTETQPPPKSEALDRLDAAVALFRKVVEGLARADAGPAPRGPIRASAANAGTSGGALRPAPGADVVYRPAGAATEGVRHGADLDHASLGRPYANGFLGLLLPFAVISLLLWSTVTELPRRPTNRGVTELVSGGVIWLALLGVIVLSGWRLLWPLSHPDLIALGRYGDVESLESQIEEELNDPAQAVCIGQMPIPLMLTWGELRGSAIWITSSWLVYMKNAFTRMDFIRLDSLVLAYPEGNKVILADCHGVRVHVAGSESGRARLLAEVLVRVPWVLEPL